MLVKDEAGKKRQTWSDGLGRTIEVDEPDASNNLTLATCHRYNLLDNLTQVDHGTQTRTYAYDGLSRVTSSSVPESGTATFYYKTVGGALCSGAPSAACRRVDARNITTTYTYDVLNRPTGTTYSDSTPAVSLLYDQTSYNGLTITNGVGRQTGMSDGSGTTAWSYDAAGRVLTERRTISGITKNTSYTYNVNGSLATITYPSLRVVTYGYNAIGQPVSAQDIANSKNYATSAHYAPTGGLSSVVHGYVNGGFSGITENWTYNNRLHVDRILATTQSASVLDLDYTYPGANNGTISSIANVRDSGRTQSFTYDELVRLSTAQSQATSGANCWGQSFGHDSWGNLLTVSVTKCTAPSMSQTQNGNNRLVGFGYDNSGNMTSEGSTTYAWSAENQLSSSGGVSYTYDGGGLRVKKSSGTLYWRSSGATLAETDLSGNTANEYIVFSGRQIALRNAAGTVYYDFADHLGSLRAITDSVGTLCYDVDYVPYGGERTPVINTCPQAYKFTGYERDSETGLDYAMFRYFNSRLGRFMTPDLLAGSIFDPQSLNRYAYVRNEPIDWTDPLGLVLGACGPNGEWYCPDPIDAAGGGFGGGGGPPHRAPLVDTGVEGSQLGGAGGVLRKLKQIYCEITPNGSVTGVSGSAGSVAGITGTLEVVRNFDTDEVTLFGSAGGTAGLVGLQGDIVIGAVYGLSPGNTNYTGGFTTISGSVGPIGGFAAASSPGLKDVVGLVTPGNLSRPASAGVTLGLSNLPLTANVSATEYSVPKATGVVPTVTVMDQIGKLLRLPCH